jgi:hypothetical protein
MASNQKTFSSSTFHAPKNLSLHLPAQFRRSSVFPVPFCCSFIHFLFPFLIPFTSGMAQKLPVMAEPAWCLHLLVASCLIFSIRQ